MIRQRIVLDKPVLFIPDTNMASAEMHIESTKMAEPANR